MKKVLIITPFTPSKKTAGTNFTKQLIERLSENNIVELVFFRYSEDENYVVPNENVVILKKFKINIYIKILNCILLPFLHPIFTVRFNIVAYLYLLFWVKKNKYDCLYFDFSQTFLYARLIFHNNKILMSHDVIYQKYQRIKYRLLRWVKCSEFWLLKSRNSSIFTFSKKDSDLLRLLYNVDSTPTNFFISTDVINASPISNTSRYYCLFAMWKRFENLHSLLWLIENVLSKMKDINIKIIGSGLNEEFVQILRQEYVNVEYLGFVDNPYPIISNSVALISPLYFGAGVKVKVVEALACGTPVIGTDVAFEGIDERYSDFMILANDSDTFITAILKPSKTLHDKIVFKKYFLNTYSKSSLIEYIIK